MDADRMYLRLKGARERLCEVETWVASVSLRQALDEAIERIDRVGVVVAPGQWSHHDEPDLPPLDDSGEAT